MSSSEDQQAIPPQDASSKSHPIAIGWITTGDVEHTSDGAEIGDWDVNWNNSVIDSLPEFAQPNTTYGVYLNPVADAQYEAIDSEKLEELVREYGNTPLVSQQDGKRVRRDVMHDIIEMMRRSEARPDILAVIGAAAALVINGTTPPRDRLGPQTAQDKQIARIGERIADKIRALSPGVAADAPSPAERMDQLQQDLDWHKESLSRHAAKLASVWTGMAEMMQKTLDHTCSAEPFNDLEALLLELKSARIQLANQN